MLGRLLAQMADPGHHLRSRQSTALTALPVLAERPDVAFGLKSVASAVTFAPTATQPQAGDLLVEERSAMSGGALRARRSTSG